MAFRHFLEKAEWRNDAFRYFPQHSATFRHFPPFRFFQDPVIDYITLTLPNHCINICDLPLTGSQETDARSNLFPGASESHGWLAPVL